MQSYLKDQKPYKIMIKINLAMHPKKISKILDVIILRIK